MWLISTEAVDLALSSLNREFHILVYLVKMKKGNAWIFNPAPVYFCDKLLTMTLVGVRKRLNAFILKVSSE